VLLWKLLPNKITIKAENVRQQLMSFAVSGD
jgi:hypothetical protein